MHESSMDKMRQFREQHLQEKEETPLNILDLGSLDVVVDSETGEIGVADLHGRGHGRGQECRYRPQESLCLARNKKQFC